MTIKRNLLFLITLLLAMPAIHCANDTKKKEKSFVATLVKKAKENALYIGGIVAVVIAYYFLNKKSTKTKPEAGNTPQPAQPANHQNPENPPAHPATPQVPAGPQTPRTPAQPTTPITPPTPNLPATPTETAEEQRIRNLTEEAERLARQQRSRTGGIEGSNQREAADIWRVINNARYETLITQLIPQDAAQINTLTARQDELERFLLTDHSPMAFSLRRTPNTRELRTINELLSRTANFPTIPLDNNIKEQYEILTAFGIPVPRPEGYAYTGAPNYTSPNADRYIANINILRATHTSADFINQVEQAQMERWHSRDRMTHD